MAEIPVPYHILKKVSLTGFASAFFASYPAGFVFDGESHDFYEAVLLQQGKIGVTADDRVFELSAGDLVLYRPWVFHRLWTVGEQPARLLTFSFSADRMPSFRRDLFHPEQEEAARFAEEMQRAEDIFFFHGLQITGLRPGHAIDAQKLIQATERFLLSLLSGEPLFEPEDKSLPAQHYARVIGCMKEHLDQMLNVEQLARLTCLSTDNLKKIFEKYAGEGAMQHFSRLKVQEGMRLLEEGSLVCEAAEQLGYADPDLFCSAFKRVTGLSPSAWKKTRGR